MIRLADDVCLVGSGGMGLSHEMDANVYLVGRGDDACLVDAGCGLMPERLVEGVHKGGVHALRYILITHAHADHACGAEALRLALGGEVCAAEPDASLIEHGVDSEVGLDAARRSSVYPEDFVYRHARVDRRLTDGERLALGPLSIEALVLPSHTKGSTCYLVRRGAAGPAALFTGDVVFAGGYVSILNVPGCDLGLYRTNIRRLFGLGVECLFPGHLHPVLHAGQRHLDRAVAAFDGSGLPENLPRFRL